MAEATLSELRRTSPVAESSIESRLLSAVMDRIACGVLACGERGELRHANATARTELAGMRSLRLTDGRVCAVTQPESWNSAISEATLRQRSRLLTFEDHGGRLTAAVLPLHFEGCDQASAVVILGRRGICSPLGLEMLSSVHGLTWAERRVFDGLVGNQSARAIADSHGVAIATVRSQIQAVRDKVGVHSISALLLRVAETPLVNARS